MRFDSDDVTKPGHPSPSSNLKNIFGNILPSAVKTNELERKYDYLNDRLETQLRIFVHIYIILILTEFTLNLTDLILVEL